MKRVIMRSAVAIILVLTLMLSITSCTVSGVVNEAVSAGREACESRSESEIKPYQDIRQEVASRPTNSPERETPPVSDSTDDQKTEQTPEEPVTENTPEEKPKTEQIPEEEIVIKESCSDLCCPTEEYKPTVGEEDIFALATECIAYDLYEGGYQVFRALAIVGEERIAGLAYTDYEVYERTEERVIYNTGFICLGDSASDTSPAITEADVESGVVIIPYGEYDTKEGFVLTLSLSIKPYSAIYEDYYFRYDQTSDYRVTVSICENDRSVWDEDIDLYSFTDSRYIFKGDMSYTSVAATPYFSDEAKAYAIARDAVDKLVAYQEKNGYKAEREIVILFTQEVLDEYLLGNREGTINDFLLSHIDSMEVGANEMVVVTTEGVFVESVVDRTELSRQRKTNGIIGVIANALLVFGALYTVVATCGAGTSLAVSAICAITGMSATVYGVSEIIRSAQDIYYGSLGDITTESISPALECFKSVIGDEEKATAAYHIWGLSSLLVQSLTVPVGAAVSMARAGAKVSVIKTVGAVVRVVAVEAVKDVVTGLVAAGVGYGTKLLVTELGGDEYTGQIVGFLSSIVAGYFTYCRLAKLDAKYNFSGIHSKRAVTIPEEKQLSREDAVMNFADDSWSNMTDAERKAAIEQLSNHVADDLGLLERPEIRYYNNPDGGCGFFSETDNSININEYFFTNHASAKPIGTEMLDTVCHEMRHYWQKLNKASLGDIGWSYDHYISYNRKTGNYYEYRYQACEADAFDYAETWTNMLGGM